MPMVSPSRVAMASVAIANAPITVTAVIASRAPCGAIRRKTVRDPSLVSSSARADGRTRSGLVLAGNPKYGLEGPVSHPYCLAHSGPDPTPEYPRGPEPPRSAQNEAT